MSSLKNIVKGHANKLLGLNKDISEDRLKICKSCPIYSTKFGGICNSKLYLDPITKDVSFKAKEGYHRGCGCIVSAKVTLPNEQCPAGKW